MKKKVLALVLILTMALTVGLVACSGVTVGEGSATYGEVGKDKHLYFPYAIVTVEANKDIKEIEIGEAFSPTGKIFLENGQRGQADGSLKVTYNNPWYKGFAAARALAEAVGTGAINNADLLAAAIAAKKAAIADTYYISIDDEVFVLTIGRQTTGNSIVDTALVFQSKTTATKLLTDDYLAKNIGWYVAAAKADKIFACDAAGTRLADDNALAGFVNGSILKQGEGTRVLTNYLGHGLDGEGDFKESMQALEAFAKSNNLTFETKAVASGGNYAGLRAVGLTFDPALITSATNIATINDTHLQYAVTYLNVAKQAYLLACAAR
jgi:hypothetical protein